MDEILKYFPGLTEGQKERFAALQDIYRQWNARINVISRKDMEHFYVRHVLHSLAIAKVAEFAPGSRILDAGTGGGFPGLPLSILFPGARFTLADSIGKKVKVVADVARQLALDNVSAVNGRVEDLPGPFDFVVSRAVTAMDRFVPWVRGKVARGASAGSVANGILYLKGGDLTEELHPFPAARIYDISGFFCEEFFDTKRVVYLPIS